MHEPSNVLVVEDEFILREILAENLHAAGYVTDSAENGEEAWAMLQANPQRFSVVLLDRRMPGIDGLEVLRRIKQEPTLAHIPVIMQTAMTEPDDILAGLRAGAHYYLTKPFTSETLLAIVATAVRDFQLARDLRLEASIATNTLQHLTHATFKFRTQPEARDIAMLLSHTCPDPECAVIGLSELMLNAVEHGNLGITYQEKSALLQADQLRQEIDHRLTLPAYAERRATLSFERLEDEIRMLITDQGAGFDWTHYLDMDPDRAFDSHGRGIAMARMMSFTSLEYRGRGNEVMAVIKLNLEAATD